MPTRSELADIALKMGQLRRDFVATGAAPQIEGLTFIDKRYIPDKDLFIGTGMFFADRARRDQAKKYNHLLS